MRIERLLFQVSLRVHTVLCAVLCIKIFSAHKTALKYRVCEVILFFATRKTDYMPSHGESAQFFAQLIPLSWEELSGRLVFCASLTVEHI